MLSFMSYGLPKYYPFSQDCMNIVFYTQLPSGSCSDGLFYLILESPYGFSSHSDLDFFQWIKFQHDCKIVSNLTSSLVELNSWGIYSRISINGLN